MSITAHLFSETAIKSGLAQAIVVALQTLGVSEREVLAASGDSELFQKAVIKKVVLPNTFPAFEAGSDEAVALELGPLRIRIGTLETGPHSQLSHHKIKFVWGMTKGGNNLPFFKKPSFLAVFWFPCWGRIGNRSL